MLFSNSFSWLNTITMNNISPSQYEHCGSCDTLSSEGHDENDQYCRYYTGRKTTSEEVNLAELGEYLLAEVTEEISDLKKELSDLKKELSDLKRSKQKTLDETGSL